MRIINSPCTLCDRMESSFCGKSAGEEVRSGGRSHCTDVHMYVHSPNTATTQNVNVTSCAIAAIYTVTDAKHIQKSFNL